MLSKTYEPKPVEEKWLAEWLKSDAFHSSPRTDPKDKFVIVIPPPNITGALHMGHALNDTLQDVLVRYHKMRGSESLWVPGTDHGGIATQNVMEKILKNEKTSRHALGREKFLERMQVWAKETKGTILGQLKRLGCALDWRREAFTMDPPRARAVAEAFSRLWKEGLIYRGERMINWCVRCGTALSDIEVEHEEHKGHLWYIHYPAEDGGEGITVATTRPETMLGDTAVAVHPDSERWKHLLGKKVRLPLMERLIPVIADAAVDPDFGEGAVKVTPAHDPNDFEIAQRHHLESILAIGFDGKITENAPGYAGLSREKAREKVVKDLEDKGLLRKTVPYQHAVPVCYRCNQVVEPLVSNQWFVRMESLAAPAIKAAEEGRVKFHPETWKKPYLAWLNNIKDWCISRQIWWGHRIPIWYCGWCVGEKIKITLAIDDPAIRAQAHEKGSVQPSRTLAELLSEMPVRDIELRADKVINQVTGTECLTLDPSKPCEKCDKKDGWFQDADVLDTWFSSALWPFSVFGWPEESPDLKYYYPTTVLVTGYEILYLWVARMQMTGLRFLGHVPFTDVFIHGIVRDKHGKKMSKSLGNVIDPLVMMERYGTDAMRFAFAIQASQGRDITFSEDMIVGARNFANKLWNTARFVLMNLPTPETEANMGFEPLQHPSPELCDRWILEEYRTAVREARARMEAYDPSGAADILYGFLWDRFCDWYLELAKIRLMSADEASKDIPRAILVEVLNGTIKLLHPFMPFITEEIWQALKPYTGEKAPGILHAKLPLPAEPRSPETLHTMGLLMDVTRAIRAIRSQFNVPPGLQIGAVVSSKEAESLKVLADHGQYVRHLARLKELIGESDGKKPPHAATAIVSGMTIHVPLEGIIDLEREKKRLQKEHEAVRSEMARLDEKLSREDFRTRAPKAEVEKTQLRKTELEAKRLEIEAHLADL